MNIGLVTTWFERGSAHVSRQYAELLKSKHNIFIYSRGGEEGASSAKDWSEYPVWASPRYPVSIPAVVRLKDFRKWIESKKLDVVFFNEEQAWAAVTFCNTIGLKTGAYIDYYTEETIPFFEKYDFLICNTQRHLSAFEWHPGAHYVPWGTDINLYSPKPHAQRDTINYFHSAGYNPHRKGTDFVLRAFEKVTNSRAKLIIHSQVSLKRFFPKMENLINKLIVSGRLEYHEKTIAAPGLYHLGDVYLYPARLDGLGLTVAEAMSCGLPVITCDTAPMNEFVSNDSGWLCKINRTYCRKDGYYWPANDINEEDFVRVISDTLLTTDQIGKKQHSTRQYAIKHLNWQDRAAQVISIFENVTIMNHDDSLNKIISKYDSKKIPWQLRVWSRNPAIYNFSKTIWKSLKFNK